MSHNVGGYIHPDDVRRATALRRTLHCIPEISNHETDTARMIAAFVGEYSPHDIQKPGEI